jgi:hypothetical protein
MAPVGAGWKGLWKEPASLKVTAKAEIAREATNFVVKHTGGPPIQAGYAISASAGGMAGNTTVTVATPIVNGEQTITISTATTAILALGAEIVTTRGSDQPATTVRAIELRRQGTPGIEEIKRCLQTGSCEPVGLAGTWCFLCAWWTVQCYRLPTSHIGGGLQVLK